MKTLNDYKNISSDVWEIFKKYLPGDANLETFSSDVHVLNDKYKDDRDAFRFMQQLLKVYFDELNEVKKNDN